MTLDDEMNWKRQVMALDDAMEWKRERDEARAELERVKAEFAQTRREYDAMWAGDFDCAECGVFTNNGICTGCQQGSSPLKRLQAELERVKAELEQKLTAEEAQILGFESDRSRDLAREVNRLTDQLDEARAELERVKAQRDALQHAADLKSFLQLDEAKAADSRTVGYLSKRDAECLSLRSDLRSLERLYARAIDALLQAERARDDARAESQRLLEENRALRTNRDGWRVEAEAAWARLDASGQGESE
jgi:hypothetical protein